MRVLTLFLIGIFVLSVVWYVVNLSGAEMRFVPIGSNSKSQLAAKAPGFSGGGRWFNLENLAGSQAELLELDKLLTNVKVKAVLVDFWTYSCINCRRTLPYLRSWWTKYQDLGLVIVGVHTPEFEFEKDADNLKKAMEKNGVVWPVVQDNDYRIWRAYRNQFWPHKYLVNKKGKIIYDHIGEGAYEETEKEIQELLGVSEVEITEEPESGGIGFGMQQTPELYVNRRGKNSGQIGRGKDKVELLGNWRVGKDYSSAGKDASLKLLFSAAEVNLVMSLPDDKTREVGVVIDGMGEGKLFVEGDDLYNIWKGEFGEHVLEMSFNEGMRIHAFTFGR